MSRWVLPLAFALSACAVGPNYVKPDPVKPPETALRGTTGNSAATAAPLPDRWWSLFADPALDALVERALAHNTDVRVASANLQRARALLSEARAARLPTTNLTASANRNRIGAGQLGAAGAGAGAGAAPNAIELDLFNVGFDASYELDLFGRVTRSIEAGRGDLAAAQAGLDAARVSVAAETARAYAQACGFAAQATVARETAAVQGRTLELTRRLFEGGRGTQREVDQASVLVENANAQVPQFEAERRAALYALATLTGEPPANLDPAANACAAPPKVALPIPSGDGAALLARRPDVRQAERQLAADTARVGVATAALYPSITLLGSVTLGATDIGDLGKAASFGYSVGPLISFNFPFAGAARARVRQAEATADASLARFDGVLLTALRETEQALARVDGAARREAALARAAAAAENSAKLSRLRFDYGADSFLQLLDAERSRAEARAALASAAAARADAQVSLFKALGGGWQNAPEPTARPGWTKGPSTP